jgi:hypothetical protein
MKIGCQGSTADRKNDKITIFHHYGIEYSKMKQKSVIFSEWNKQYLRGKKKSPLADIHSNHFSSQLETLHVCLTVFPICFSHPARES